MIELGVGLIRIGRRWGHVGQEIPSEGDALTFLKHAATAGIRFFDTAPCYGLSEERLGKFLRSLTGAEFARLTVATKFGEHWDTTTGTPYIDHSFDALRRSLDQSLSRLSRIDVLQLHKTTPAVLASDDLQKAWEYARSLGISKIGPSVSDVESANIGISDPQYSVIQLPLNVRNTKFEAAVDRAAARGMLVLANRPFAMGAMLYGDAPVNPLEAFVYLLRRRFTGVILTGTARAAHLDENLAAFRAAQASLEQAC